MRNNIHTYMHTMLLQEKAPTPRGIIAVWLVRVLLYVLPLVVVALMISNSVMHLTSQINEDWKEEE
jgi:hypothetical protein